jgi:predicted transcriptional regulator
VSEYLFLPIQPLWALAILEGKKKWELRTKRPSIDAGDIVVLYATSPLRAVVGSFVVGDVVSGTPAELWKVVHGEIDTTRTSYLEAFGERPILHALRVTRPKRLDPYTPTFAVGQGWRFLHGREDPSHRSVIERVRRSR